MTSTEPRYKVLTLKRRIREFSAMIVDTQHPSGCPDVEVLFTETVEEAQRLVDNANARILKETK